MQKNPIWRRWATPVGKTFGKSDLWQTQTALKRMHYLLRIALLLYPTVREPKGAWEDKKIMGAISTSWLCVSIVKQLTTKVASSTGPKVVDHDVGVGAHDHMKRSQPYPTLYNSNPHHPPTLSWLFAKQNHNCFQHKQIVQLCGGCVDGYDTHSHHKPMQRAPPSLGLPTTGGPALKVGALPVIGTLSMSSNKLSSSTSHT